MCCLWVKCPTWNCCGWEERSIMCTCECVCACVWVFINIWGSRCWELFFLGMNTFCISGKRWDISCCNLLWAAAKDSFYCFTRRGPSQGPSLVLIAPGYCSAKWWRDLISWKYFGKRVIREKQKQKNPQIYKRFNCLWNRNKRVKTSSYNSNFWVQNTHWKGWTWVGRLNDCVKICFFTSIIKDLEGIAEQPMEGYLFIVFSLFCARAWPFQGCWAGPLRDLLHMQSSCSLLKMWLTMENFLF